MAQDIVPIELGLPQGDVVTLWAPRWREDGEEWEAFLGHEDDLYGFVDTARLAAFVRTNDEHDLIDHPAWHVVPALSVGELTPDEDHQYDLVGVPELMAEDPDTWVISELADIVAMVRSLADVCELEQVHEILDSATGFAQLDQGTLPFSGREGAAVWTEMSEVVAEKWDVVLDAIDEVVT
ncbi:MAG TPA: primosomal protein, partial [Pseudonocardiaceae bacterium]|nr:primosomal protein [Pseudonocardiaceae bacterium]